MRHSWCAIVGCAFFAAQLAPGASKITLEDLVSVSAPGPHVLSPDGRQFAIIQSGQIALVPVGGGPAVALTSTPGDKSEVRWSPDGKKLAFVSQGGIWVVAAAGGQPKRLTDGPVGPGDPRGATDRAPRWNPTGKWILYESGRRGQDELYVVNEAGGAPVYLASTEIYHGRYQISSGGTGHDDDTVSGDRFDPSPTWSPDGTLVAYAERSREFFSGKLKVVGFDPAAGRAKGAPVEIYTAKADRGGAWAVDAAGWSTDGKNLAVVLQDSGWDKVYLLPATGGTPKQLTYGQYDDLNPVFSPDGKSLAVVSNRVSLEEQQIWIVPLDGSAARRLTNLPAGVETNPQWSPDGSKIYFFRSAPLQAPDLYVAPTSGNADAKALTKTTPAAFEQAGFKLPEEVHFKGKDGLNLAGILYRPVGFKAGTRYPAVLWIHGGPEGQDTYSFSPFSLYLAQEGYLVLLPNYRGSTGHGEKFRNLNVEDSGGAEIDDIGAAAQYLVYQGLADPKRLAIGGGSHGGTVVANAVVKLPDLFAAALELYGVVDRALFLQYTNRNSAIRWEIKMGGLPDEKPAVYRKANVLLDVAKIKTPLLVMHGEEDPQVPPQESQQFTEALKKNGKTFSYVTYPREGHGFREREHRLDAWRKQLAFLRKYLKPEGQGGAAEN